MADSKLTREHSLALLHNLATDDGFRSRYEQNPAAALAELGVPQETIAGLKASCLVAGTLAEKDHFARAHAVLADTSADSCLNMIVPNQQLNFGSNR